MNAPHAARSTIAALERIVAEHIDAGERLAAVIDELSSELRDARNDYQDGQLTVRLCAAREAYKFRIERAAQAMRTAETLRAQGGLDAGVLSSVAREFLKS